jgi:hypothetical protein
MVLSLYLRCLDWVVKAMAEVKNLALKNFALKSVEMRSRKWDVRDFLEQEQAHHQSMTPVYDRTQGYDRPQDYDRPQA